MSDLVRIRLVTVGLCMSFLLFRALLLPVGALVLSAVGLLMVQQYWLALLVLSAALLLYEGGYWLFVGRWVR